MTLRSRWLLAGLALLPALWIAGCSSSSTSSAEVTLTGVSVSPRPTSVVVGSTRQLTATATYSDGSTANVTTDASWASNATTTATVTVHGGLVSGVAAGTARVTASLGGKSASSDVTVTPVAPTLQSIALTPDPATVSSGATLQLTVTGTYSDTSTANVTADATFVTSDAAVATVTSPGGLVTGRAAGTTTITATVGALTARRDVTVAEVQPPATAQIVFWNAYGDGVSFRNFDGATNNVTLDSTELFQGRSTIRFEVTGSGGYSGGAWVTSTPRDLSAYDALTFWAKASVAGTLNVVGFGNESGAGIGTEYPTERAALPLATSWQKYTIPIPDAAKFVNVAGLFHLADAPDGYTLYLADVLFEHLGAGVLGTAAATIAPANATSVTVAEGARTSLSPAQNRVVYSAVTGDPANPVTLNPVANRFFSFTSADPGVATVDPAGVVTGVAAGGPVAITATLAGAAASGSYAVTVTPVLATPAGPPPVPTHAVADVRSFYSSVTGGYAGTDADYAGSIETWRACWSGPGATGGDPFAVPSSGGISASPRKYVLGTAGDSYVGIELIGKTGATQPGNCGGTDVGTNELDATAMDHLHIDIWSPDVDLASNFQVKLQDAGADGIVANGDPWAIYQVNGSSLARGTWQSLDFALSSPVAGALTTRAHIAQIVLQSPGGGTFYVDNLYLYAAGTSPVAEPASAAAAPTSLAANVRSLFSSTYTGGEAGGDYSGRVDSYEATCFAGAGVSVADFAIPSAHTVKKYTWANPEFAVIELIGASAGTATPPDSPICGPGGAQSGANLLDVSAMTRLHLDVWSPTGNSNVQVHLVNVDAGTLSGPGQGAGATAGTTYATGAKTIPAGTWTSIDLDLATDLSPAATAVTKLGLVKLYTANPGILFVDNVYFYRPAPFPTLTFDGAAVTYTATGFGGAYGFLAPDPAGATSVMALVKTAGAETWAGATLSTGAGLTVAPVPFTATKKSMTMRVYSPAAGTPFLMKLENPADGTASVEKQVSTTVANAWETLTFDFGSPSGGTVDLAKTYDKLSVFPSFGTAGGASDTTYYVDDIAFVP
jgi:uncharacterized protein YjdB